MEEKHRLTYAPTPPTDRAEVTHAADGFTLTLPPALSWSYAFSVAIALLLSIQLFVATIWPLSAASILHVTDLRMRLIGGSVGFGVVCFLVVQFLNARRGCTVITVRNDRLQVIRPRLFRSLSREYWLDCYNDARTDCKESMGCLTLIRTDGKEQILLRNMIYSQKDLRFAATVLRQTIKQLDAQYARQEVAIKVAMDELNESRSRRETAGTFLRDEHHRLLQP